MGKVLSINISPERGTEKTRVIEAKAIANWGLDQDAHAGDWDRQISIFPEEALAKVPTGKREEVLSGGYTENITINGIPLEDLKEGTSLEVGEAIVKITHVGKDEYKENGRPYIVSREGRFGIVLKGGKIKIGDDITVIN